MVVTDEVGHAVVASRPRRLRRRVIAPTVVSALVAVLVAPALPGVAPVASAPPVHARLLRSEPADSSVLDRSPERLVLVFSEPVDVALGRVVILGPGGMRLPVSPEADSGDARVMTAIVPPLDSGGYRVEWRIASADGHPIEGTFVFGVSGNAGRVGATGADPGPPGASAPDTGVPQRRLPANASPEQTSPAGSPGPAAVLRGVGVGALAAFAGVLAFLAWIARTPAPRLRPLAIWLGVAACLGLAAHALVWMRYVSPSGELGADVVRAAAATGTGKVEALRVGLALLALGAVAPVRRVRLAAVLALLAVAASGAVGHPAAIRPELAVPAKAIHLLASALWLGGLLALAVGRGEDASDAERVSSAALASVIAIALTGVLQTVLFLPTPADLVRTSYGLLVVGKAAGLGVLVLFGARNRYTLLPALAGGGAEALRRSVRWEVAVMAAVVLLGGLLAYVPVPPPRP